MEAYIRFRFSMRDELEKRDVIWEAQKLIGVGFVYIATTSTDEPGLP